MLPSSSTSFVRLRKRIAMLMLAFTEVPRKCAISEGVMWIEIMTCPSVVMAAVFIENSTLNEAFSYYIYKMKVVYVQDDKNKNSFIVKSNSTHPPTSCVLPDTATFNCLF